MTSGERKEIVVRERSGPTISHWIMAFTAVHGEPRSRMVRRLGGHEIGAVAVDAIIPQSCESEGVVRAVAIHTTQVAVNADQRETVLFVQFGDLVHQPCTRRMATGAVIAHGHGVYIHVARNAIRCELLVESHRTVARLAVDARMYPDQGQSGAVMVETQRVLHGRPTIRKVTSGAIDLERLTVW